MAYSDKVLDHYSNPRNVGSLDKNSPDVGTGLVGAPECGDVMKLQIKVNPQTNVIEEAKFKTFGCGSAIASSSLPTRRVKGKTVDEALSIKNTEIVKELSLPPVKIHCSVLAEDAIRAAIHDWKKKKGVEEPVTATSQASHEGASSSSGKGRRKPQLRRPRPKGCKSRRTPWPRFVLPWSTKASLRSREACVWAYREAVAPD